jgi:hypothetical protein
VVLLEFKCVKCGEVWAVETAPPNPEPISCCPRCAGFVRRFLRSEQLCEWRGAVRSAAEPAPAGHAAEMSRRLRLRTPAHPPLNRLH